MLDAEMDSVRCKGGDSKLLSRKIMRDMGLEKEAIKESWRSFVSNGGYCDCEIVGNVAARVEALWGDERDDGGGGR